MSASTRRSPGGIPGPVRIAQEGDDGLNSTSQQLAIWAPPMARASDPPTSQVAAADVERRDAATAEAILRVLAVKSSTVDEIAEDLDRHPPTISSAVSRLAKRGLVRPLGERLSKRQRPMTLWHLVDEKGVAKTDTPRSIRRLPRELKVEQLLTDGRVSVRRRDAASVEADVRGHHGLYSVSCDDRGRWDCTCACYGAKCTHIHAVALVTGIPR